MAIYDIVCGKCGKTRFKMIDNKETCENCGYIMTDKDIDNLLEQCYRDYAGVYTEPAGAYIGTAAAAENRNVFLSRWEAGLKIPTPPATFYGILGAGMSFHADRLSCRSTSCR